MTIYNEECGCNTNIKNKDFEKTKIIKKKECELKKKLKNNEYDEKIKQIKIEYEENIKKICGKIQFECNEKIMKNQEEIQKK